ncbi:MAG: lipase family protein [Vulcanimicrobiota bacterium]
MVVRNGTPHIPVTRLFNALDSKTTAEVLDQVDLSKFQADKTFSQNNAVDLAALSTLAYSTPADQAVHLRKQKGVEHFWQLSSADNARLGIPEADRGANLTVVETRDALIVAARGTAPPWLNNMGQENGWSWKDLGADLNTMPVSNYAGDAYVHQGFKDQADSIWGQLQGHLKTALAAHKAIHMTGHSLGAAVALQLADRMHNEMGVLPQAVLRLGGPDTGWSDQKAHLERSGLADRTYNVHNCGDPIPLALPGGKMAGREIYLDRKGEADLEGGRHLLDRALGQLQDMRTGHAAIPLYRHFPQFYLSGLSDPANARTLSRLEK